MKIVLRSKLHPFYHLPGTKCLVPFSTKYLTVFPTLIRIACLKDPTLYEEIPLNIKGPVTNFTVIQDLEKGEIAVSGATELGLLRYIIRANRQQQLFIRILRSPSKEPLLSFPSRYLQQTSTSEHEPSGLERIHLGIHKTLDWELVKRRLDMREILPVWHRLGQLSPLSEYQKEHSLLDRLKSAVESAQKDKIYAMLQNLFLAGFTSLLVPRSKDEEFQGFDLPPVDQSNLLSILTEGSQLIRSLFLAVHDNKIKILPSLPKEIICGKVRGFASSLGSIDFEWSKRAPRRMVFKALNSSSLSVEFPKNIRTARLRLNDNDKGVIVNSKSLLNCEKGRHYFFDQFAH
ncbi:Uncharacterized protein PHSC3_000631 [Chlamydiales bacterium STE3]|nr:Uncharacterized protein PHSC3_000631 [Chlamydiales bacterium STE3]